jgi:FeS assembly SUF system protein
MNQVEKIDSGNPYDELAEPPNADVPRDHALWPKIVAALREIYDPEIPVNIYELGLIYAVILLPEKDGAIDIEVKMSLTSPGCPVAQEMPGWVQSALLPIEGVGAVDVEIIWDPTWSPAMMAETAKMQLNMFY